MATFTEVMLQVKTVTKKNIDKKCTDIAKELFMSVVEKSPSPMVEAAHPYSRGQLANNWFTGINSISSEMDTSYDDYGTQSRLRVDAISYGSFTKDGDFISLANNTPQAIYAEKLGWQAGQGANGWVWSGRASTPIAMVANSITEVISKYK